MNVEILGTGLSGFVYLGNLRAPATWTHADGMVAVKMETADLTTANLIELRQLRSSRRPLPIVIPGNKKYRGAVVGLKDDSAGVTLLIAKA